MSEELEFEPIPGLPQELPPGERLLWQGRPQWRSLAHHTFELPWLTLYFAALGALRALFTFQEGRPLSQALVAGLWMFVPGGVCLGLLALLAFFTARATVFSITSRRVVMRFGVALPMTFNLPFRQLAAAELKPRPEGDGDIALQLAGKEKIAFLPLWPYARPWRFARPQPMLRSVPQAQQVAALLAQAVREAAAPRPGALEAA
jgi:Bacterial PH domain